MGPSGRLRERGSMSFCWRRPFCSILDRKIRWIGFWAELKIQFWDDNIALLIVSLASCHKSTWNSKNNYNWNDFQSPNVVQNLGTHPLDTFHLKYSQLGCPFFWKQKVPISAPLLGKRPRHIQSEVIDVLKVRIAEKAMSMIVSLGRIAFMMGFATKTDLCWPLN